MITESTNEHLKKSREIPVLDYFSLLQLEYISYAFRFKIYIRPEDKKKFSDILRMKKEKIKTFSTRNCLPDIFNGDPVYLKKYMGKFFKTEFGLPNFQNRDDHKAEIYGRYDPYYYFAKGTQVKVRLPNGSVECGMITNYFEGEVKVTYGDIDKKRICTKIENVSRILTEAFLTIE
jgi:hypothetical protein